MITGDISYCRVDESLDDRFHSITGPKDNKRLLFAFMINYESLLNNPKYLIALQVTYVMVASPDVYMNEVFKIKKNGLYLSSRMKTEIEMMLPIRS